MQHILRLSAEIACLLVTASLTGSPPFVAVAYAHGSSSQVLVLGQRVGAYDVTVRATPKPPRIGRLHLQVQLIEPKALSYVTHAGLTATAMFREEDTIQMRPVSSQYRHPWHEMDIDLEKSGSWDVYLTIDGPFGREMLSLRIEVRPAQ